MRRLLAAAFCLTPTVAAGQPNADQDAIRAAMEAGARACESGRPEEIMRSYARDISLSYPGIADQDYDTILEGYRRLCRGSGEGTVETTRGTFQEILVSGDLAVVRVIWNTRLRGMSPGTIRRLQDMQVWRRTPEGWRFFRGVHFPLRP